MIGNWKLFPTSLTAKKMNIFELLEKLTIYGYFQQIAEVSGLGMSQTSCLLG